MTERNSYQWSIDEARQLTHCSISVMPRKDGAFLVFIETPEGKPLFKAECHDEHLVQFVIQAVGVAYYEMMQ